MGHDSAYMEHMESIYKAGFLAGRQADYGNFTNSTNSTNSTTFENGYNMGYE